MNYIVKLIVFVTIFLIGTKSYILRRECFEHHHCPENKPACFDSICMNLCEGSCGINTFCKLRERVTPVCYCLDGMIGDPFVKCWKQGLEGVRGEGSEDWDTEKPRNEEELLPEWESFPNEKSTCANKSGRDFNVLMSI